MKERKNPVKIDPEQVKSLLEEGKNCVEIAEIIGASVIGVRDCARRNNLKVKVNKTDQETIDKIIQMVKDGYLYKDIMSTLNVCKHTITKYVKEYNIKPVGKRKVSDYDQSVRTLYNEGYTAKQISEKLKFSHNTIQSYLKKIGLDRDMQRIKNQKLEKIKELHSLGLTNEQIMLKTGCSKETVRKYLEELSLKENIDENKVFINIINKLEPMDDLMCENIRDLDEETQKNLLEYIIIKEICKKKSYLSRAEAERLPKVTPYYLEKFQISIPELNRRCGLYKPSSIFETQVEEYLIANNIKYETQKKFEGLVNERNLRFDFYLPDYNILVECDGVQHVDHEHKFANEGQILRDELKNNWCKENNIQLIRIPYTRYASDKFLNKYFPFIHPENSSELQGNS